MAREGMVPRWILRLVVIVPAIIGTLVLLGWLLDAEWLRQLVPVNGQPRVKANTAICIVATAVGLGLLVQTPVSARRRRIARGLAVLVCLVGGLTLAEHVLGVNAGIDQLVFHEQPGALRTPHLGRMAANTSLSFVLLGIALLAFDVRWRRWRPANILAGSVGAIALVALIGILLGTDGVPIFSQYARMAPATAVALVLLSLGAILARPDTTLVRVITGAGPASQAARWLAPIVLLSPALLGYLRMEGQRRGLYGLELGTWLLVVSVTAVLAGASWALIRRLHRADLRSKAAELASREAQAAADKANLAKSEFLSRMSHELRTPLNAILGFGQLLEMNNPQGRDGESVAQILRAGRHLLGLIDEVLDISRIEAGTMRLSVEQVDVVSALGEVIALMVPVAAKQGIEISTEPGALGECYVLADRPRLRQVILNLVSNAVKYNRPGGSVDVAFERDEQRVKITVADTGHGIASDRLDRLFVAFDRLGAESGDVQGTGLGLALSKSLAEQMGGTLTAQSTPGSGSVFTVELETTANPVDQDRLTSARTTGAESQKAGSGTVLYIEDNPSNIKLVEHALAGQPDLRLILAMQGRTGLELAKAHRPDLILLDLHLPDIDGAAVLERLQSDPGTAAIPVIVLSADANVRQLRALMAGGARAYLTKPLDVGEFLAAVDEHLPRKDTPDD